MGLVRFGQKIRLGLWVGAERKLKSLGGAGTEVVYQMKEFDEEKETAYGKCLPKGNMDCQENRGVRVFFSFVCLDVLGFFPDRQHLVSLRLTLKFQVRIDGRRLGKRVLPEKLVSGKFVFKVMSGWFLSKVG